VQREQQRQIETQLIEQALTEEGPRQTGRYPQPVLEQIRADFLQIQVVERKLTKAVSTSNAIDLALVARSATEIRKRSARLKKNLDLPKLEANPAGASAFAIEDRIEALRIAVGNLSNLIGTFVRNPMFEQVKLVDSQLSARAQHDLEAIVGLSSEIKRTSEKLKITGRTP
jgi:hypothetical protein